jgi:hypothetical protein
MLAFLVSPPGRLGFFLPRTIVGERVVEMLEYNALQYRVLFRGQIRDLED